MAYSSLFFILIFVSHLKREATLNRYCPFYTVVKKLPTESGSLLQEKLPGPIYCQNPTVQLFHIFLVTIGGTCNLYKS